MTEVWWCAEHEAPGDDILIPASPCFWVQRWSAPHREKPCRLVEMRLVPVDALVIVRDAEGNWPAEPFRAAAKELEEIVFGVIRHHTTVTSELAGHWAGRVLGAAFNVAEAVKDNPQ